ncbi:MAG: lycopene cyclase [Pelagibacteraceae bacterium]|nr:lycopene cyclase [Pelagibacteraceae bacterium]
MKEFDYVIIGGGCAGLSLAYELEIHNNLIDKKLAIIEPREDYKRDKSWSFWRVTSHNFNDCIKKSWKNFTINISNKTKHLECSKTPYQTIDSGLFYEKIMNRLKLNKNIFFFKNINEINTKNSILFNSVSKIADNDQKLWQHFYGIEIEADKNIFDDEIFNLMDFDCDQKNKVHFFYTLPFSKNQALVETTWISELNDKSIMNYEEQIKNYLKDHLKIKKYKINYSEKGAIPLFQLNNFKKLNQIDIGTVGGMTRLSTGYTFLNIQEQCKYIRENIQNIQKVKLFQINKKYKFFDEIFLKVLKKNPEKMPNIFYKMFESKTEAVINFLSNKSNLLEDLLIVNRMPKWIFIKALFN